MPNPTATWFTIVVVVIEAAIGLAAMGVYAAFHTY